MIKLTTKQLRSYLDNSDRVIDAANRKRAIREIAERWTPRVADMFEPGEWESLLAEI